MPLKPRQLQASKETLTEHDAHTVWVCQTLTTLTVSLPTAEQGSLG